jgi:hypothetical protein
MLHGQAHQDQIPGLWSADLFPRQYELPVSPAAFWKILPHA